MEASLKAQWLTSLRGGMYKQTSSRLRDGDGFCCLGVLCDILVDDGLGVWEERVDITGKMMAGATYTDNYGGSHLSTLFDKGSSFQAFLALPEDIQSHLIGMNDTGSSFTEIADYIEETL